MMLTGWAGLEIKNFSLKLNKKEHVFIILNACSFFCIFSGPEMLKNYMLENHKNLK